MTHPDIAAIDAVVVPEQELATTTPEHMIAEWKKKTATLTIEGENDKAGYEVVRKEVAFARTTRTSIEKKRKELKEPHLEAGRLIDSRAKELIALVEPEEDRLKAMMDAIDNIAAERKAAAERERLAKIEQRKNDLFAAGVTFNGQHCIGSVQITQVDIEASSDEAFAEIMGSVQREAERIAAEKAEQQRLQNEEAERIRQQQQELRLKQQALEAQEREARKLIRSGREAQLIGMGLEKNGQHEWTHKGFPACDDSDLDEDTPESWKIRLVAIEQKIKGIDNDIRIREENARIEAEKERVKAIVAAREKTLHDLGYVKQDNIYAHPAGPVAAKFMEECTETEWAEFSAELHANSMKYNEEQRIAALSDIEKFREYLGQFKALIDAPAPDFGITQPIYSAFTELVKEAIAVAEHKLVS